MNAGSENRLRIAAFLQFFVLAGVIPVMSLYLKGIEGISGSGTGVILAMGTAASIASPLVSLFVADRIVSAERLFAMCNLASSLLLAVLRMQTSFHCIAATYLVLMLFLTPPLTLINIMVFKHLGSQRVRFGSIRVWGTFGWIFMSLFFSYVWLGGLIALPGEKSIGDILYFSSISALILGLYSLTIRPVSALPGKTRARPSPAIFSELGAGLEKKERKMFALFFLISLMVSVVDKYYYLGLSPYLRHSGIPDRWIMPVISAGNISEIILMFLLYRIITVMGFRKTLAAGVAAEILRFTLFSLPGSPVSIMAAILVHGATFALYSSAAFIYLDMYSCGKSRSANHLVYSFAVSGGGTLFGNLAAGVMLDYSLSSTGSYSLFWRVPAVMALLSLIMVVIFIKDEKPRLQENS